MIMELKKYQQEVLDDIDRFNECLAETDHLGRAFRSYWERKGISLQENDDYLHEYVNTVRGVPRVTLKVPTAGGKTFIACNALRRIFDSMPQEATKAVAWFVPYDTIQKQTYRRLSDPTDPYRQRIDTLFGGRVRVYDKETLLVGQNFNPVVVREQLSIFVLSIQSFATNTKDGLRSKRENENLAGFVGTYTEDTPRVKDADETSLMQVLASLNPVVVIDESHNFTADLRVETLQELNPRYILELTATPRRTSNIISFVDAYRLKAEHMVKLPVIVYNQSKVDDVVTGAINLQRNLERKAKEAERHGGDYIRPIVLFQAQPKRDDDNTTFENVKAKLTDIGIPEEQIKIKTANVDELKGQDLMSRTCEVRYIITVDALKEGWDCPFAYILASLANKTSRISVEQILGRILRQPYTRVQAVEFLNLSYVFTCSADFQKTLTSIVESLNRSGFSPKDYVAVEQEEKPKEESEPQRELFAPQQEEEEGTDDFERIDTQALKASINGRGGDDIGDTMLGKAAEEATVYNTNVETARLNNDNPTDIMNRVKSYAMKDIYAEKASAICLPQFFIKEKKNGLFSAETQTADILLSPSHLLQGFNLETQDRNIDFARTQAEAVRIDLEKRNADEYAPKCYRLNDLQLKAFSEYFRGLSDEGKVRQLTNKLTTALLKGRDAIGNKAMRNYVKSVLMSVEPYELQGLADNYLNTQAAFERKIGILTESYKRQRFRNLIDTGKVFCKDSFSLSERITPKDIMIGVPKSLYLEENKVDDFEYSVITEIANLGNVLFWHRNFERGKGFFINGFVNHYPDFIVVLKSGEVLLIETKGDHLDGSDSEDKIKLGRMWANKAGAHYRYFMVFDQKKVYGAYTLSKLLMLIKKMADNDV